MVGAGAFGWELVIGAISTFYGVQYGAVFSAGILRRKAWHTFLRKRKVAIKGGAARRAYSCLHIT